jgi:phage-related holin
MKEGFCTLTGILGAALCWAFGGWDSAMAALLVCMSVDYISGSLVALVFHRSTKSESGSYNSLYGLKGLARRG